MEQAGELWCALLNWVLGLKEVKSANAHLKIWAKQPSWFKSTCQRLWHKDLLEPRPDL